MNKKSTVVFLLAAGLLCGAALVGCASWLGDYPTICTDQNKQLSLKTWAQSEYSMTWADEKSVLCDVANKNDIHLDYTGDLIFAADLATIRSNPDRRSDAVDLYSSVRNIALEGAGIITGGDLSADIFKLMADYPELGLIAMPLLYKLKIDTTLLTMKDVAMIVWWCDRNLDVLNG